jgi:hypothetical protein
MSRKIYNRLSFMAVSWLDESTLVARLARYERLTIDVECIDSVATQAQVSQDSVPDGKDAEAHRVA